MINFVRQQIMQTLIRCCILWHLVLGPELQCPLKVKEDFSEVLIFQHAVINT